VIAAGFDGGSPAYRPADLSRSRQSAHLADVTGGQRAAATASATVTATPTPRRVLFDDVDVPDFLKNGA
jgi:cell division protein FtsZ